MLRGTPVSPGVAQGMAFVMSCVDGSAVPQRSIRPSEVDGERQRLDAAIVRAQAELLKLFRGARIDSIQLRTDQPYASALGRFFETREKRRRHG